MKKCMKPFIFRLWRDAIMPWQWTREWNAWVRTLYNWYMLWDVRTFFCKTIDDVIYFCANKRCIIPKVEVTWPLKFWTNAAVLLTIHTVKMYDKQRILSTASTAYFGQQQCNNFYEFFSRCANNKEHGDSWVGKPTSYCILIRIAIHIPLNHMCLCRAKRCDTEGWHAKRFGFYCF